MKVKPIESVPYAKWPKDSFKIESDFGEIEGSYDLGFTYVEIAKLFKEVYGGTPVPQRLHRRAVELLGDQFRQKMREALFELTFEVFYQVISELTDGGPATKTRDSILHAADDLKKRRLKSRGKGAPPQLAKEDLMNAIVACRARNVEPTLGELEVETDRNSTTISRAAKRYGLEDKIEWRKLRK